MELIKNKYYSDNQDYKSFPTAITYNCPYCGDFVNFALTWNLDRDNLVQRTKCCCNSCKRIVQFFRLNFANPDKSEIPEIYIYPASSSRKSIFDFNEVDSPVNIKLKQVYESAIKTYNFGEWNGAIILCRKLLEGIMIDKIPNAHIHKNDKLFDLLNKLPAHMDFALPITDLAHSLRKGGNLAAHFNSETMPDLNMATKVMDLLEYLIEYIYILPTRIEALKTKVDK